MIYLNSLNLLYLIDPPILDLFFIKKTLIFRESNILKLIVA
jgi:hypothetical protein